MSSSFQVTRRQQLAVKSGDNEDQLDDEPQEKGKPKAKAKSKAKAKAKGKATQKSKAKPSPKVEVKDCPAEGDEGEVLDEEATAPEAAGSALSDIPRASAPTATISEDGQAAPEEEPEKAEEPKETARKGEPDKAEEPEGAAGKEEPEEPNPNNVKRAKTADKATSPNAADSKVEKPVRQRKSKAANGREKVEEAVDGPQEVAAEAPTKRRRKSKDGGDGAVEEPTKEVLYRGRRANAGEAKPASTFAKRKRPATLEGRLKWDSIREVFNTDIRPFLKSYSAHEDCRVWRYLLFISAVPIPVQQLSEST